MERGIVKREFTKYVSEYDTSDPRIDLKIKHTNKVADISELIATTVSRVDIGYVDLCWLIGMLHDIGRFEQLAKYGTFLDVESVDHAEFGADLLFKNNLINRFWTEPVSGMTQREELHIIDLSIRQHNKLAIPGDLLDTERFFCNIIRDADKIDIFRVVQEVPYGVRMTQVSDANVKTPARREIMECVRNHTCVPRMSDRTSFEAHIAGCCMAFELVYPESWRIVRHQGYLKQMLSLEPEGEEQKKQMNILRSEMEKVLNEQNSSYYSPWRQ